jgi:homoserine kinase
VRARAPGSSANLGPGFDALALALDIPVEVIVRPARRLTVRSDGEGAELPQNEGHLAARVAAAVAGHDRLEVLVSSEIPVARGLGSSAALALAAAAAAGAGDPLGVAVSFEGHPENAAASALGGLVVATFAGGRPLARRLPLDERIGFVVLVPDRTLSTSAARAALPASVPLADAAANLGRLGLLIAGLGDAEGLVSEAGEDRLHQPARTALFPEAPQLMARLREAGAVVACWSGAGPSVLGICAERALAPRVRDAAEAALAEAGLTGRALQLEPDLAGLRVEPA